MAAGRERHATNAVPITAITIALIRSRRLKYVGDKESAQKLDGISIPTIPAVVIHFYRQRKDEPLHALGIELWVGQQKKAAIPPVHTLGWTEGQVKAYIRDALS